MSREDPRRGSRRHRHRRAEVRPPARRSSLVRGRGGCRLVEQSAGTALRGGGPLARADRAARPDRGGMVVRRMRAAAAGADRLLGARCRGGGADRAGVRAGWLVRGDQHPHPSHGCRRAAPHTGGQRGSPGADRPATARARAGAAPSSPTPTAPPRRWRWRWPRCTGRSASRGCSSPRCRQSPAPAIPAWHRSTSSATSSRTSEERRKRSSGRAARSSAPSATAQSSRRGSRSAPTPTALPSWMGT